ncbi:MAG: ROK family protein [Planctomycetes bacterium]|nr:ROK family protein [Planctomycetota bacterium]
MAKVLRKLQAVAHLDAALVQLVHAGQATSRAALSRELKLVPSTAGIYVDRLLREGFLLESAPKARSLGRPPTLIQLNPSAGRFIGVDFDARQIMATAVDFAQKPLKQIRRSIPPKANTQRVLSIIEDAIAAVIGTRRGDVLGIGLAVPGHIDVERGIALWYRFIPDWRDVPIVDRLAGAFKLPVSVENNLRSMALAELWMGQGRGARHLVCLGIRSGIGAGIIADGKLLRGSRNLAGEVGSWNFPLELSADADFQGAAGRSVEDVASFSALLAEAAQAVANGTTSALGKCKQPPTAADLIEAAAAADALAERLVLRAARVHGWIAHQLSQLLDPERIILSGPLAASEMYLTTVRDTAAALSSHTPTAEIVPSTLGPFAGALGAAALAFQHWKPRR